MPGPRTAITGARAALSLVGGATVAIASAPVQQGSLRNARRAIEISRRGAGRASS